MTPEEVNAVLNDPGWQQTAFDNLWQIFIVPAVQARQKIGELPNPIGLDAVHVILYPDGKNEIRVNDEVKLYAEGIPKPNANLENGTSNDLSQFERIVNFRPREDVDINCGYIILLHINGAWQGAFNFIYNREHARRYLSASQEFLLTAKYAANKNYWSVAFDCLFSAAELAISTLLSSHSLKSVQSKSHQELTKSFEQYAQHGNVDSDLLSTFMHLSLVRKDARYPHKPANLDTDSFQTHFQNVEKLFEQAKMYAGISLEGET